MLLLLLLVAYPLAWLIMSAFGMPDALTFNHIMRAYTRPQNVQPLLNTVWLAFGAGLLSLALGVPLAWASARSDLPFVRLIRAGVALAYVTPPYLTALAYIILLGPEAGYLNRILRLFIDVRSGPINIFSLGGVIAVVGLHCFAFTYFMAESALRSIDAALGEAARMLGASPWQVVLKIDLPLVAPAIAGGALLAAVESMALFGPQAFLGTPGQVSFLPTRIYGVIGAYPPRWGEAAALSLILVLLTCLALLVQRIYLERRSYITLGGKGNRPETVRLGPWRWPIFALCFTVVVFAAFAPVSVLVLVAASKNWVDPFALANLTIENFRAALVDEQMAVRGIANSFKLAAAAGLIAIMLGAAIAFIDQRTRATGRRLLDYLAILPLGIPGTVMALALILAFIRPPLVIYATIWILLAAYVARYVPLATRSLSATLRQIDPSLEDAARMVGATWWQAIRLILVPLAWPGIVVAFLLVFIPALSELSATILLYTGGTETISIAISRLNDLGRIEVVAALAVFTIATILTVSLVLDQATRRSRKSKPAERLR